MKAPAPRQHAAPERSVLLFDGVCHLCHASVQFVIQRERSPALLFAALQSDTGRALLRGVNLPEDYAASLVLFEDGRMFTRSDAALRVAGHLRVPWSWLRVFRLVPRVLRDPLYSWVARNRYRWFGREDEACLVPDPELEARFLK